MSGAQHTPGEWKVADSDPMLILDDYNSGKGPWRFIAGTRDAEFGALPAAEAEANAARIVRCVNAHDALVQHLREALVQWNTQFEGDQDDEPWCVAARATLLTLGLDVTEPAT